MMHLLTILTIIRQKIFMATIDFDSMNILDKFVFE